MSISDKDFREAFKPLKIPVQYNPDDSDEDKVVYALALLEQATAEQVAEKLSDLDPSVNKEKFQTAASTVLSDLFEMGLIKGKEIQGDMQYDLSKITEANEGDVNPDLLAPGLD